MSAFLLTFISAFLFFHFPSQLTFITSLQDSLAAPFLLHYLFASSPYFSLLYMLFASFIRWLTLNYFTVLTLVVVILPSYNSYSNSGYFSVVCDRWNCLRASSIQVRWNFVYFLCVLLAIQRSSCIKQQMFYRENDCWCTCIFCELFWSENTFIFK